MQPTHGYQNDNSRLAAAEDSVAGWASSQAPPLTFTADSPLRDAGPVDNQKEDLQIELLYGQLPEFVKDEAELRALWSSPDTRSRLLQGLAEKGFGDEQLAEMQAIISAEHNDLFDVLAHVAYALPPIPPRNPRPAGTPLHPHSRFTSKQQLFLDFVLQHDVNSGVQEELA
jgi:hypothetical protein